MNEFFWRVPIDRSDFNLANYKYALSMFELRDSPRQSGRMVLKGLVSGIMQRTIRGGRYRKLRRIIRRAKAKYPDKIVGIDNVLFNKRLIN